MAIEESWGHFFKSETKSSGRKLFSQDKISITSHSDTGIHAYVKIAPPVKVVFSSAGVAGDRFSATCACPNAKRGQFCKHIWATLLAVESEYADFLSQKRVIEKAVLSAPSAGRNPPGDVKATANERASEYRKEQYQKQKARVKEKKHGQKRAAEFQQKSVSEELGAALDYFRLNGFPMPEGPSEEILLDAKKRLSRVFHPDKGGSHEEMVELNRNCEIVLRFL